MPHFAWWYNIRFAGLVNPDSVGKLIPTYVIRLFVMIKLWTRNIIQHGISPLFTFSACWHSSTYCNGGCIAAGCLCQHEGLRLVNYCSNNFWPHLSLCYFQYKGLNGKVFQLGFIENPDYCIFTNDKCTENATKLNCCWGGNNHSITVSTVTRLHTRWPRVQIPVGARDFVLKGFRPALGPTQPPIQRVLGVKWLGCEINRFHLVPRLGMSGAVTVTPIYSSMMWTG